AGFAMQLDPTMDRIRGRSATADLETLLELVHLGFSSPRADPSVFQNVLGLNRSFETNVVMNPALSFLNETLAQRFDGHPRTPLLIQPPEAWSALTLDQTLTAY